MPRYSAKVAIVFTFLQGVGIFPYAAALLIPTTHRMKTPQLTEQNRHKYPNFAHFSLEN